MQVEGMAVDVTIPPAPVTKSYNMRDLWLFLLHFAAIRKAEAERTRYRGYQPLGMGLRAQARSRGFDNVTHMNTAAAQARAVEALVEQDRRIVVDAAAAAASGATPPATI